MTRVLLATDECVAVLIETVGARRERLQLATTKTVEQDFGISVRIRPDSVTEGCCRVAGTYFHNPDRITVAQSTTPRRLHFTILHELAHCLIRNDYALFDLARSRDREERVCDLFAAEILLPQSLIEEVIGSAEPSAAHLVSLYLLSAASGAVCARAAGERLKRPGYAVVATDNQIHYSFGHSMLVELERFVPQPPDSLFESARINGRTAVGVTQLLSRPGHWSPSMWGDVAIGDDGLTFGVFTEFESDNSEG